MLRSSILICSLLLGILAAAPATAQSSLTGTEASAEHVVIDLASDGTVTLAKRSFPTAELGEHLGDVVANCEGVVFDLVIAGLASCRHVEALISGLRGACADLPESDERFLRVSFGLEGGAAHLGQPLILPAEGFPPTQIEAGHVLAVGMTMGGRLTVGDKSGAISELKPFLEKQLAERENLIVLIDPHPDASYRDYYETLRMAKLAGASRISLWGSNCPIELVDFSRKRGPRSSGQAQGGGSGGKYDVEPQIIYQAKVEYPKTALDGGVQGTVQVMAFINEQGFVFKTRVVQSTAPQNLMDAATDAVAKFRFSPAEKDGKPVKSTLVVPVEFKWDAKKAAIN
jgi:TonB family protein